MVSKFGRDTTGNEIVAAFADAVQNKTFAITGPSTGGLGAETAISLAKEKPAHLILIGRSQARIQPVIDEVKRISPATTVTFVQADFASLASVRKAAEQVKSSTGHIDCLINNAAIMACPAAKSEDGFELQFATNYLAHFALTNALIDVVSSGGRIVNVSSLGYKFGDIHWDDVNLEAPGAYKSAVAYGQSKTANILHALELNRRLQSRRIAVFSLHPGSIATNLQQYITDEDRNHMIDEMKRKDPGFNIGKRKSLQEGCSTQLRAALDPSLTDRSGSYLDDCQIGVTEDYASDKVAAEKLWTLSERLIQA